MKKALLLVVLCYSNFTFAQQKTASVYQRAFSDFARYYNTIQPDSMTKLFKQVSAYNYWTRDNLKKQQEEMGKIIGFKYIGPFENETDVEGNVMVYFKVTFDKKAHCKDKFSSAFNGKNIHAAAIALNNENIIVGRRLFTSSPSVDSLIAQY
jgi:hypothetical protein